MIMCVLLYYPVSIRIYYQQGGLFLVYIFVVHTVFCCLHCSCYDSLLFHSIRFVLLIKHHPGSGVITGGDVADSPVIEKMDDNRGLLIIHFAS